MLLLENRFLIRKKIGCGLTRDFYCFAGFFEGCFGKSGWLAMVF
jgi:hypothetical protein